MVPGVTRISRALHAGIYREAFTLVEEAGPRNLQPFTRGSARGIKKTSVEIDISVRSCRPIYRSVKAEQGESRLSPRLSPPFFPLWKNSKGDVIHFVDISQTYPLFSSSWNYRSSFLFLSKRFAENRFFEKKKNDFNGEKFPLGKHSVSSETKIFQSFIY